MRRECKMMRYTLGPVCAALLCGLLISSAEAQIIIKRPPTYMGQPNPLSDEEALGNLRRQKEHDEQVAREAEQKRLEEASRPQIHTYRYEYYWWYNYPTRRGF